MVNAQATLEISVLVYLTFVDKLTDCNRSKSDQRYKQHFIPKETSSFILLITLQF